MPPTFSRPLLIHASTGDSWTFTGKSGSVSCGVTVPVSCILVHTRFCLCPPRVYFPVLCKFWWLYGGVNGDLLSKVLCHTQVYCTQRPWPCSSPLLTCTSAGDTQTQFCLSLGGVSGSWSAPCMFEPSEHLWWVWSLILNAISPFHLAGASLPLDMGYLLTVAPVNWTELILTDMRWHLIVLFDLHLSNNK